MRHYEITYMYGGKKYIVDVWPIRAWEEQYHKNVLDRAESILNGGGIIIDIREIITK